MYQTLLTRRYLMSKIMPVLALAAVSLSVATVTVTWSVMGGFLETLLQGGRKLMGDVSVIWPTVGFAHYEDLIERLESHPEIDAAAPIIETFGMVQLPDNRVREAIIRGVEPRSFNRVTGFDDTLWWRPMDGAYEVPDGAYTLDEAPDIRLDPESAETLQQMYEAGQQMERIDPLTGEAKPAAVLGIEFSQLNYRTKEGFYAPSVVRRATPEGRIEFENLILPHNGSVVLNVIAFDSSGRPYEVSSETFPVANEFQSGIYDMDDRVIYVPLARLQTLLNMDEAQRLDPTAAADPLAAADAAPVRPDPARVTMVFVRGRDPTTPQRVQAVTEEVYASFAADRDDVPSSRSIQILTWEQRNATLVAAVRKETAVVLVIFGIVCFTTVFLVLAIFWSMISEKTRDIGVLRSLGASRTGVAGLWLSYGFGLGVVGSALGLVLAMLIVTNLNEIHTWIGSLGPVLSDRLTAVSGWFGGGPVEIDTSIWNPQTYYFTLIPTDFEWYRAAVVFGMGVTTCVVGAAWPAVRAARMDPVRALRFE